MGSKKFRVTFDSNDDVEKAEESEVFDEELYEEIEAPKFVDFTKSDDPFRPDDRYWFCQRVGCDLKHEEELDPEEISKNFVLRVMAARSPNIRFRKALNGRNTSANMKCPHSAPAKSAKSRVSRLAMLSSIPQMSDVNVKVARAKISSAATPMRKSKIVAAKYMTTPRNKRCLQTSNNFRSVQNTRTTTVQVPKSHKIVKSLAFHSPKKAVASKTSVELCTPLTKLCEGMKRLEITSQSKRVLGYSIKSSKEKRCAFQKSMPVNASRRQLNSCNEKSRVKNLMHPCNIKDLGAKSVRNLKSKSKQDTTKDSSVPKAPMRDTNDIKIDVKSQDGDASNLNPLTEISSDPKEVVLKSEVLALKEKSEILTGNSADGEMNSFHNMEKRASQGTSLPSSHSFIEKGFEGSERTEQEAKSELILENEEGPIDLSLQEAECESEGKCNDDKGNMQASDESRCLNDRNKEDNQIIGVNHENEIMSDDKENCQALVNNTCSTEVIKENNQTLQGLEQNSNYVDGDDKENVKISDGNRYLNKTADKRILGCKEANETKKVVRALDKRKKEYLRSATVCASNVKYGKPKLTNPKPFRLRTDERWILKVANSERQILAPQKEPAPVSRFQGANCQRRNEMDSKGNEKSSELNRNRNDKCSYKESDEKVQKLETKWSRIASLNSSRAQNRAKLGNNTPQRNSKPQPNTLRREPSKDNSIQRSDCLRKKTFQQFVRPQSNQRRMRPSSVIEESLSTSNLKETHKPNPNTATGTTKAGISAGMRSLSKGKTRPLSIKVA